MATRSAIRFGAAHPVFVVTDTDRQRIAPGPMYLLETNISEIVRKARLVLLGVG